MNAKPGFQFKLINTLIVLIIVPVCLSLAYWQSQRVEEKKQLQADYEQLKTAEAWSLNQLKPEEFNQLTEQFWQPVSAKGRFLNEFAFFLDSQVYQGKPGYHFIVPMKLEKQEHVVLVNFGWLPAGNRNEVPDFPKIDTNSLIVGQLATPKKPMPGFEQAAPKSRVQLFINIEQLSDRIGHPLLPMVIQVKPGTETELKREWPEFKANIGMHQFYVFHWLLVAIAAIAIYIYLGLKKADTNKASSKTPDLNEANKP